jgi:hypothetical protein
MNELNRDQWKDLMKMMVWVECAFESFVDHEILGHIQAAKAVVPFKTMCPPKFDMPIHICGAKYFGGMAFGPNMFLRCHMDKDFMWSVATVLVKNVDAYMVDDDIVVYFCFPTLGVVVPLRPGDYLPFDATIPHCISSRCHYSDNLMCISIFLKSLVLGLNNNALALTNQQKYLSQKCNEIYHSSN